VSRPEEEELPAVGTPLVDTARSVIGQFQQEVQGRYYLRPVGGGREWDVDPKWVRPATDEDLKSGHLKNRRVVGWSEKVTKQ
jgi:hypothetical protein